MCCLLMTVWRALQGEPHQCNTFYNIQRTASVSLFRNLFDVFLKPYFLEAYRPVHKGGGTRKCVCTYKLCPDISGSTTEWCKGVWLQEG